MLSVAGAVGFFTDGVIGLVVNPALAGPAPATVEATGAMFTGVVLVFYVVSFAVYMIGLVVFGLGMLRAGSMPRAACLLLVAGAVPMNLPTLPVTHVPQVIGGLLVGAASVWLGARLIALADRATGPARTSA